MNSLEKDLIYLKDRACEDEAKALAHSQSVVRATDGLIDKDCWEKGLSAALSKLNL